MTSGQRTAPRIIAGERAGTPLGEQADTRHAQTRAPRRVLRPLSVVLLIAGALSLIALAFASGAWVAGATHASGLLLAAGVVALLGDRLERRGRRPQRPGTFR